MPLRSFISFKLQLEELFALDLHGTLLRYSSLCSGHCMGIFPEGGSHDRTDLLPLKAGVAVIALEAHSLHHVNVPIVPVGLNYFRGHQFGGRVVVEFGAPIWISEEIHAAYETNRREATEELLNLVAAAMRSVIIPTEDYKTLQQIFMVLRWPFKWLFGWHFNVLKRFSRVFHVVLEVLGPAARLKHEDLADGGVGESAQGL